MSRFFGRFDTAVHKVSRSDVLALNVTNLLDRIGFFTNSGFSDHCNGGWVRVGARKQLRRRSLVSSETPTLGPTASFPC